MNVLPPTRRIGLRALPLVVGLIASAALVLQSTNAAFTGATSNGASTFSAATVSLTDDDAGAVLFNASNMVPGDSVTRCIKVTYTGSSYALDPIRLYSAVTDTGLAPHLNLVVEQGTGGTFSSCAGFTASSTVYSGTLAALGSTHSGYTNGATTFTPASGSTTRTYRVTASLGAATPNSAQGTTAGATLTWEVHSN